MIMRLADSFIASDQTGTYPRTSSRGNKYICVFYTFDPNYIKGMRVKSRHSSELLKAYNNVYKWYAKAEVLNQYCTVNMDNETPKEVEDFIQLQQTGLQYAQLGRNCRPAEKAVQTYKACFKSTTASFPPEFPIFHWCRLQLNWLSAIRKRKINSLTNRQGYDKSETSIGKLLAKKIQICCEHFCIIHF